MKKNQMAMRKLASSFSRSATMPLGESHANHRTTDSGSSSCPLDESGRRRTVSEDNATHAPPKLANKDGNGWEDFCQKTSLSGFKFLSSETTSKTRRACWAFVMVTLVSLTAYQNFKIIKNYVETPYIINVEKIFLPDLKFPKILICNTMSWRVSAVTPPGIMHTALGKIFSDPDLHVAEAQYFAPVMQNITDSRAYLKSIAFGKEDMIIWCQWRGIRCGVENFTTELLPDRVCFSFNGGLNELRTYEAGGDHGLQLVLDIGQYEQMNGPYETFGIQQAFLHRDDVPSIARALSVPAGYYTFVNLFKREIQYMQGENCGYRQLSMFPRYSREACLREHIYTSVYQRCACWPFSIEPHQMSKDSKICTLAEHFTCALPLIQRVQQDNVTKNCPLECYIKTYVPTTSFAAVAWDQIRKRFQLKVGNFRNRTQQAFESAKRYRPMLNRTTAIMLSKVRNATDNLKGVIGRLNHLSIDNLHQLPPTKSLHPFDNYGTKFVADVLKPAINDMAEALKSIVHMVADAKTIFENATIVKYLLDEYIDISSAQAKAMTSKIFSVSLPKSGTVPPLPDGRTPYRTKLNLLLSLSRALTKIRLTHRRITKGVDDYIYSSSSETVLRREPALNFTQKTTRLFKSLYGFSHGKGCMEGNRNPPIVPKQSLSDMADLFGCLILFFSSESIRTQAAENYRYVVSQIPDDSPDADHQYSDCKELLCNAYLDSPAESCEFNVENMQRAGLSIVAAMQENIDYCAPRFNQSAADVLNFMDSYYIHEIIHFFTSKRQIAENFRKNNDRIRELMKTRPWVSSRTIDAIYSNISAYQLDGMPYRELARCCTRVFRNWLDTQFQHNFAHLYTTLSELVVMFKSMKSHAEDLLEFANPLDLEEMNSNYSISAVIMNNLLWGRTSISNLQIAVNVSNEFLESAQPILGDIPDMTAQYVGAVSAMISDSDEFLKSSVVNDAEFFKRNFLIMNVHYAELSTELISQNRNLEFWKLLADLGGSNGLWLSFSMVVVFEIMDICLRHWFSNPYNKLKNLIKLFFTRKLFGRSVANGQGQNRPGGIDAPRELSVLDRM